MIPSPRGRNPSDSRQSRAEFCLEIAEISLAVSAADPDMKIQPAVEMKRFIGSGKKPDLALRASWRNLTNVRPRRKIFDSGSTWQLYSDGGFYYFHCFAPTLGATPYQIARLNGEFNAGEIYLHKPYFDTTRVVNPLLYPLDELLMVNLLSRGRGVEIHACGLIADGRGYLFVGHSGVGKTTMARLWEREQGIAILSDDRIIIRRAEGQIRMYGTPWHGEADLALPYCAPLEQIYFLRHGAENALVCKSAADAAAHLFACTFPTFYDRDGLACTLGFYEELAETVPCHELSFIPDMRVVEWVRGFGTKGPGQQ